jgi:tRNA (guanine9-N1)-methyltransferase
MASEAPGDRAHESGDEHSADDDGPADAGAPGEARPSKNSLKRAARKDALKAHFVAKKQKAKAAKARARDERAAAPAAAPAPAAPPSDAAGAPAGESYYPTRSRKEAVLAMRAALDDWAARPAIAIDLSNDELQTDGERTSLIQQLTYCYGLDRRSPTPLPLFFTSFGGRVADALERISGVAQWPVGRRAGPYWREFSGASVVVLSADATEVLSALEPGAVYVIGGIVDHNRHKGLLASDAAARGLRCVRLPLDEHSTLASRKVLTVNHVFHLLLRFHETHDWPDAIAHAIPQRKGLTLLRDAPPASGGGGGAAAAGEPAASTKRGGAPSAGASAPAVEPG